jgi:Lysine methyltransferase
MTTDDTNDSIEKLKNESIVTDQQRQQQQEQSIKKRQEVANARWRLLRDALLQKNNNSSTETPSCSIHRFSGYQLIKSSVNDTTTSITAKLQSKLTHLEWNATTLSMEQNLQRLEIAVLALATCYPKGKCLQLRHSADLDVKQCIGKLSQQCQSTVIVLPVDTKSVQSIEEVTEGNETALEAQCITTLLIQEASSAKTKYCMRTYFLNGSFLLLTREPQDHAKLSLQDMVSHRHNQGVDNTGNICVWDSEKTLTYLLWNHSKELLEHIRENGGCSFQPTTNHNNNKVCILELGTGMAGLSAVTLGMQLVLSTCTTNFAEPRIQVTLTDGNATAVHNNKVNQYLMEQYYQQLLKDGTTTTTKTPYLALDIDCQLLVWTTDMENPTESSLSSSQSIPHPSNIVLVSDCVHFQNFHAALAMTTLRNLNVGGTAVFCQPMRGDSLDNFCHLLDVISFKGHNNNNNNNSNNSNNPLVQWTWWEPDILQEQHVQAMQKHSDVYDERLHRPKILIVTKLRELTTSDRQTLVDTHQQIQKDTSSKTNYKNDIANTARSS